MACTTSILSAWRTRSPFCPPRGDGGRFGGWLAALLLVMLPGALPAGTNTYYVVAGNAGAQAPFDAWTNAAADIQTAVNRASGDLVPGSTECVVLVSNGTYTLTSQITLTNGITLRSLSGREATFINGNFPLTTNRCLEIRNSPTLATVDGFTLTNGYAYLQLAGGGIFVTNGQAAILNCTVARNQAATAVTGAGNGGGIGVVGCTNFLIAGCLIDNNSTVTNGSGTGIYIAQSRGLVTTCTHNNNVQTGTGGTGGGLCVSQTLATDVLVSNCTFSGNYANDAGGLYAFAATVTRCVITNNGARSNGGGVQLYGSSANRLTFSTVAGNRAATGGGIAINRGSVFNCSITGNYASASGGGYTSSEGSLRNCLIAGNRTDGFGGGVSWIDKPNSYNVVNCTIVRNSAGGSGGGISTAATASNVFINVIVSDNQSDVSPNIGGIVDRTNFIYSCSPALVAGRNGNVTGDPQFVDPGSGFGTNAALGDYHILVGSPAIDAGLSNAVTDDLDGIGRPLDGDGDGLAACDMGAYEAQAATSGALRCSFSTPTNIALDAVTAVLTAHVAGTNTNTVAYFWTFGDGVTNDWSGAAQVGHSYGYGSFTVTLSVSNELGEVVTHARPAFIVVYPSHTYVSTNGANVSPYGSWATAARSIQDAVNVAATGVGYTASVLVSNGVYVVTNDIVITNPVTLRGFSGNWADTVIRGGYPLTNRCLSINHSGAWVDGFTVTNGYSGSDRGGGITLTNGTVTNCLITGNRSTGAATPGAGGGIYVASGAAVYNCVIRNNTGNNDGGGVFNNGTLVACTIVSNTTASNGGGVRVGGGTVDRCWIMGNSTTASAGGGGGVAKGNSGGAIVRNCVIVGNTARNVGGGIYMGTGSSFDVQNCTVAGNAATNGGGVYMAVASHFGLNCIVTSNQATRAGATNDISGAAGLAFRYSCSPDLVNGQSNNLTANPRFVSAGSGAGTTFVAGDYRLRAGSVCADSGTNLSWMASSLDFAGDPRVLGAGPNMGAYEKTVAPLGAVLQIH